MKAVIPPELTYLVPLPVMMVLENITDVTKVQYDIGKSAEDAGMTYKLIEVAGEDWESFLALEKAGANASWNPNVGWGLSFIDNGDGGKGQLHHVARANPRPY